MRDWQAAARNWILNANKYSYENPATNLTPSPQPRKLDVRVNKNYAESL